MKGPVTEKTRWGAKGEAHRLHGELKGLAIRLKENELDDKPALDAAKVLWKAAEEVEKRNDAEKASKQAHRDEVNAERDLGSVADLRREVAELKKQLALQPNR